MVLDELGDLPGKPIEVTVVTDYFCTHCAKGSNVYGDVFQDGLCTSCGRKIVTPGVK